MIKRVSVYCASSAKVDKVYFDAVEKLAINLVKNNIEVVFGGGALGLMGKLADTVIEHGGKITGIMPVFMKEVEWAHKKVAEFYFVEDMHERKKKFLEDIDAVIALPGGCGTLEELLEAITLKRLGLFTKPILILNTGGFYNSLKEMLDKCIKENFMAEKHKEMWSFVDEPDEVINAINTAPEWNKENISFAAVK